MDKPGHDLKIPAIVAPPVQGAENEPEGNLKIPAIVAPPVQGAENEPEGNLKIPVIVAPPVQGAENEPEGNLKIPAIVAPPVQGAENEPEGNLKIPAIVSPPVQGAENEPDTDFTIPLIELKESPSTEDEPHKTIAHLFAEGQWNPSADPLTIGQANFSAMQNLRFAERNLEGVPGYTKINVTTVLPTYLKIRAGIQLQAPFTTKSRVLAQAYNAALTASQIVQNKTAIPNQGDFESAVLHTDAAGAGLGRFAKWPGNQIGYCNGVETKIYGGDEIPCAALLNFDSLQTFFYDFTDQVNNLNTGEVATLTADTGGAGVNSDVALLLHFDNDLTDTGPLIQIPFTAGSDPPDIGEIVTPPPPILPPLEPPAEGALTWLTDKTAVVAAARAQGKKILLLAGRESCSVTTGMRDTACESLDPPLKALIETYYIPWFINVDAIPNDVNYYGWYLPGSGTYDMPLIAVIDPANVQTYVDRSYGNQNFLVLYNWLLQYVSSGASGVVSGVQVDSGSWAGGDAAGTILVNAPPGSWTNESNTLQSPDLLAGAGAFLTVIGWTAEPAAWTYNDVSGLMDKDADGTGTLTQDTVAAVAGKIYTIVYTISRWSVGSVTVSFGGTAGTPRDADGTYTETLTATNTDGLVFTPSDTSRLSVGSVALARVIASYGSLANGHTVTNTNVAFSNAPGNFKWGYGAVFNGMNAYLSIPAHPDFNLADGIWTMDFWAKFDDISVAHTIYFQKTDISSISFSAGAHEPVVGEIVHGDTSAATGIVDKVTVAAGAWGTSDAAGIIYLHTVTGVWQNPEAIHDPSNNVVGNTASLAVGIGYNYFEIDVGKTAGVIKVACVTCYAGPVFTVNLGYDISAISYRSLHHYEFSESGDMWYLFVDGVLAASASTPARAQNYVDSIYIGYENGLAGQFLAGVLEELRVSKVCRHTATFSVPLVPYAIITGSGLVGNVYIGSLRPLQGIKFYVQHANDSAATAAVDYWDGSAWAAVASPNDATAAAGKTLNVTGGASITFTSTVDLAKPIYLKGYFLYFYRVSFVGIDADTSIYQVTVDAPFQTVVDLWDGSPLLLSSCLRYLTATASYKDFTLEVAEYSQVAFAEFDALATTEYILFGSPVPLTGFNLQLSTDAAKVNGNVATMTVAYCDGNSIADWPLVTGLADETAADSKSLKQSGVVSFAPVTPRAEFKISINGGSPQYYYKLSFSAALSAAVEVGYITGIPAPQTINAYKFPFSFLGRAMLCGYLAGNEGNRVDYAMANSCSAWNGPDSSGGVDNAPLYFGGSDQLTAACEVYNRLGSSIYSFAIFTKEYETYILNGYDPATYRIYPISSVHGCPAPETMDTYQVGISKDAQSVRSIAMWLSHSGPVMFDSGGLVPVPGLECYFDRRDSRCVNSAAIKSARGWFDPDTGDYNLQIPSGSGQTTNNVWVALSVNYKKWYCVVPSVKIVFASGAHAVVVGEPVHQATSGATGIVLSITLTTGAWATSDQAGTILLGSVTGTWANGNNMEDAGHTVVASCTSCTTDPYLGAAFRVADTDGRQYVYGGRDNGYMMRIHNPAVATWDGTASVQSITLGDLLCTENVWEKVRLRFLKIFGISATEDVDAAVTHYADGASAGTSLAVVALNATPRYFKNTQALNLLAWSHQIKISATISTEARGMRLLGWGLKYMIEREDL